MEDAITSAVAAHGDVEDVHCRTAVCRAIVLADQPSEQPATAQQGNDLSIPAALEDALIVILASSDGRLTEYAAEIKENVEQEGRMRMTLLLAGPPSW